MILKQTRHFFSRFLNPIILLFDKLGITPNMVTLSGGIFIIFAIYAVAVHRAFLLGIGLALLSALTDLIDGDLARYQNRVSKFGGVFDSVVDRIVDMAMVLGFLFDLQKKELLGLYSFDLKSIIFIALAINMVPTVLISYTKARASEFIKFPSLGLMQRAERAVIIGVLCLAIDTPVIFLPVLILFNLLLLHTFLQRLNWARQHLG